MFTLCSGDSENSTVVVSLASSLPSLNKQFHVCEFLCIYVCVCRCVCVNCPWDIEILGSCPAGSVLPHDEKVAL